jgi:hypothetical protein
VIWVNDLKRDNLMSSSFAYLQQIMVMRYMVKSRLYAAAWDPGPIRLRQTEFVRDRVADAEDGSSGKRGIVQLHRSQLYESFGRQH